MPLYGVRRAESKDELNLLLGDLGHLAGEQFKSMTGTNIVHVPYKGPPPAIVDLIAGRVDLMFASQSLVATRLQAATCVRWRSPAVIAR
jgi:hypothetical protein